MPATLTKDWPTILREAKAAYVERTERGDIVPMLWLLDAEGDVLAWISAPDVMNEYIYEAATMMIPALRPAAIVFAADAHMAVQEIPEGTTPEQAMQRATKRWPKGSMQRACDEEGACEAGELTDCILLLKMEVASGRAWMDMLPYSYHGRGTDFRWSEKMQQLGQGVRAHDGDVPATFRRIFKSKLTDNRLTAGMFIATVAVYNGDTDKARIHMARTFGKALDRSGYGYKDYFSRRYPEWADRT